MLNENHYVKLFAFELIFIVMSASFVTVNRKNRPQNPYSETPRAAEKTRLTQPRVKKRLPGFRTTACKRIRTDDYSTIDTRSSTALSKGTLWPLRGTIFRLFGLTPKLVHERIVDILGALVAQVLVDAAASTRLAYSA